jgi:hypothetical protein
MRTIICMHRYKLRLYIHTHTLSLSLSLSLFAVDYAVFGLMQLNAVHTLTLYTTIIHVNIAFI